VGGGAVGAGTGSGDPYFAMEHGRPLPPTSWLTAMCRRRGYRTNRFQSIFCRESNRIEIIFGESGCSSQQICESAQSDHCTMVFSLMQEKFLVRFCSEPQLITAVCCGRRNVTAARELVSIITLRIWAGCCSLCALSARRSLPASRSSPGDCTSARSVNVRPRRQESI